MEQWAAGLAVLSTSGRTTAELAPWQALPWCSATLCMRVEPRSSTVYRSFMFLLQYMNVGTACTLDIFNVDRLLLHVDCVTKLTHLSTCGFPCAFQPLQFYDNASPPLIGPGKDTKMQFTHGGLYEFYSPRGVCSLNSAYVLSFYWAVPPDRAGHASLAVVYNKGDGSIAKIMALQWPNGRNFTGTVGGCAITNGKYLWTVDDSIQQAGNPASRNTLMVGFRLSNLWDQVNSGRQPGVLRIDVKDNKPLAYDTYPLIASTLSFDADDFEPRLWVAETWVPAELDTPEQPVNTPRDDFTRRFGWAYGFPIDIATGLPRVSFLAALNAGAGLCGAPQLQALYNEVMGLGFVDIDTTKLPTFNVSANAVPDDDDDTTAAKAAAAAAAAPKPTPIRPKGCEGTTGYTRLFPGE